LGVAAAAEIRPVKTLFQLIVLFSSLSLLSIGGGNSVLPEMHHKTVEDYHWMDDGQFSDIFAISQAAPGPSILIVTLVGYKAAGIIGALVATVAMMVPAGLLVYLVTLVWERAKDAPLRHAIEKGFAPLTVGLVLATAYVMGKSTNHHDWRGWLLTVVCTVIFTVSKVNPLIVVGAAGLVGWLGWA
jgi:chromate transporter